ncbi:MAG: glycosyltransferase family 39 protein [Desulfofustis sp.]|nr:glycosyltransferase family 39 protein [Desulfofustis sp.]
MLKERIEKDRTWLALWAVLLAAALCSRPLIPIDETRYLSVAWEMWQNGDFLVPHINGVPYSHKPPLLFWLIHCVWAIFGVGELSARLVAPLWGLISILLTLKMAQRLWPDKPQIRAAVPYIMLGALIWSVYSTFTMFDTLLTGCVLLSMHSVYSASLKRWAPFSWMLAGLFIGLGILAKGPIVCVYVLPAIVCAPVWVKPHTVSWPLWYLGALFSTALGVGVALCWALPAASAGGEEYAKAILLHQTADRVINSFAHNRPFFWYLTIVPLLFFPWFFWPPSWRTTRYQWKEPGTRFCLVSIVAAFVLLSSISGKQMHYVLPAMPLAALLIARNLANLKESKVLDRFPIFIIMVSLGIALVSLPVMSLEGGDRAVLTKLPVWLPVLPVACAVPLLLPTKSSGAGTRLVSVCMAALFVTLHVSLREPLHATYSQHEVARFLESAEAQKRPVAVFPADLFDQFQFSGRLTQALYPAKSLPDLMKWARRHPGGYSLLFTRDRRNLAQVGSKTVLDYNNGWLSISSSSELTNPPRTAVN